MIYKVILILIESLFACDPNILKMFCSWSVQVTVILLSKTQFVLVFRLDGYNLVYIKVFTKGKYSNISPGVQIYLAVIKYESEI